MRAVPAQVIRTKIDELSRKLSVISDIPFGAQSEAFLRAHLTMLNGLIDAAEASAEDLLDRAEAMKWSGLGKDALENYPHIGSHSAKRWRRRHLPVKDPFGTPAPDAPVAPVRRERQANGKQRAESGSPIEVGSQQGDESQEKATSRFPASPRELLLRRAVEESIAM